HRKRRLEAARAARAVDRRDGGDGERERDQRQQPRVAAGPRDGRDRRRGDRADHARRLRGRRAGSRRRLCARRRRLRTGRGDPAHASSASTVSRASRRTAAPASFATAPRDPTFTIATAMIVPALAAGAIFWLAYDGGGYSLTSYTGAAIIALWTLLVGSIVGW